MADAPPSQTCYRHPNREAGIQCQRCGKIICPSCMNSASVGFHCPECTKKGAQKVYRPGDLQRDPLVTYILIGLNVLVFVIGIMGGEAVQGSSVGRDSLTRDFALKGFEIDSANEWYRIFTSGFLHGGIFHLGMNMYALYILGQGMERSLGAVRFLSVYLAAMAAGSFGALLLDPGLFTVGASGAIYGLFAMLLVNQLSAGVNVMRSGLGPILLLNFFFTFGISGISVGGHVGGFIGGALCGALLFQVEPRVKLPKYAIEAAIVVLGAAFFFAGLWAAGTWSNPLF